MRILCTADWHIGKKLESFSRLEEQKIILDSLVHIAEEEYVDAVIIAGDCFDIQSPSPEMSKLFVSTLARLARGGKCLVLVIAGNHDNPLFLSTSEAFASQVGVVILGYPHEIPSLEENHQGWKVTHRDRGVVEIFFKKYKKAIRFLMSPYANAQRLKKDLGIVDSDKKAWEILCEEWQKNISPDPEVKTILVTHSYLLPEKKDLLIQDEEPKEDSGERSIVGTLGGISLGSIPEGIEYVIAGHIHKPQALYSTKTKAFYTGSPLIYSLSESGQEKSVLILDLGKKDKEYLIPLPTQRDVKEIHFNNFDTIDELLAQEKENYLILIWEGERYFTAEEHIHLRNSHPYILRIESRPTIAHKSYDSTQIEKIQDLSTKELFQEYFQYKYQGQLPPEDLLSILGECLDEEPSRDSLERKRGFLPKSLKIQGFYSYKKEVEVDFSLLEEKGFFGIFGNTGSGKSALIEAMIIALYYKVERFGTFGSGGKGNFSNSYGIMNLDSDELLIEFSFEIEHKEGIEEYLCRVQGTRDKKKSTEVKIKRSVLALDQGEWIPIEDKTGEELLGISYDDFRKTIVLQQRDFLGFISAAPKENTETLMRLFQLERFDLYFVVDHLDKKDFARRSSLDTQLSGYADCTLEQLDIYKEQHQELEEKTALLTKDLDEKRNLLHTLSQLQKQRDRHEEIQKELALLEEQKPAFNKAKERLAIVPFLEGEQKLDTLLKEEIALESKVDTISKDLATEKIELELILGRGQESAQKEEELKGLLSAKQLLWEESLNNDLGEQFLNMEVLEKDYQRTLALKDQTEDKLKIITKNLQQKSSLQQKVSSLKKEEDRLRDLIGLSKALDHLHNGEPCPLCGSLEHPYPTEEIDSGHLERVSQEYQEAYKHLVQLTELEKSLEELEETRNDYKEQLQTLLEEYDDHADFKHSYNKLLTQKLAQEETTKALKKEIQEGTESYNHQAKNTKTLREQYSELEKNVVRYETEEQNLVLNKEKLQLTKTELIAQQGSLRQDLKIDDFLIQEILSSPQKSAQEIEEFFDSYKDLQSEMNALSKLSDQFVDNTNKEELENSVRELSDIQEMSLKELGSLQTTKEILEDGLIKKAQLQEESSALLVRKDNFEILKKLFKGSGFVHFIGQKYLDKLCYAANKRFLRFTQNQFELSAPDQLDDKKGRIVVIDRLAGGHKRDLLTLSGGQSFQAALALALALADESGAGHKFFFIDEGFGSLDNDSLYAVLETLRELSENENRVVGVISHVPLMKEEVSACLHVVLDKTLGTQLELQIL